LKKRIALSFIIFLLIFCVFGIFYSAWGFDIDDCGVIFSSRLTSVADLLLLFEGKDQYSLYFPSNYDQCHHYFFGAVNIFYRPLTLVFFGIQYALFGANPAGYFLVMIFFHAVNCLLLFNIFFALLGSLLAAFLAALYFGFHMSLWGWMGWIAAQPYATSLTLLLLAIILFFSYLRKNTLWRLILACFLYGLALFLFEFVIVFPIFITLLYVIRDFVGERTKCKFPMLGGYLKKVSGFWLATGVFIVIRLISFTGVSHAKKEQAQWSLATYFTSLKDKLPDLMSFLVDLGNLSFIPGGNRLIKGALIAMLFTLCLFLFFKNKQKKVILFLLGNGLLFMWPALLKQYTLRYGYYALPFFILAFVLLILFYQDSVIKKKLQVVVGIFSAGLILFNIIFLISMMNVRQAALHEKMIAYQTLVADPRVAGRPLCFLALPRSPFCTGHAQALWMLGINRELPIYYDHSSFVACTPHVCNKALEIIPLSYGFRLKSLYPDQLWWLGFGGEVMRMGERIVHDVDAKTGNVYEVSYLFDQKYLNQGVLFVAWDFENYRFAVIDLPVLQTLPDQRARPAE